MSFRSALAVASRRGAALRRVSPSASLRRIISSSAALGAPPRACEDEESSPPQVPVSEAERAWMDDWATLVLQTSPRDEVSVPESERRGAEPPVKCGGCTCAALPSAALCAAPSAEARALLYDPRLPCPLRRVRGFACDVERAAADAAAAAVAAAAWPGQQPQQQQRFTPPRAWRADRREAPPEPAASTPRALPHSGAEWREVLGIPPPQPLPCLPIRGEPPTRRAAALAAAVDAAAATTNNQPRSASG